MQPSTCAFHPDYAISGQNRGGLSDCHSATIDGRLFVRDPPQTCRPGLGLCCLFEFGDPPGANLMDDAAEFLDAFAEPGQFLFADPVLF